MKIDDIELKRINNLQLIGFGIQGECYRDKDVVYKLRRHPINEEEIHFLGYKDDFIAFPKELIEYNNNVIGYTMNYMNGYSLNKGFDKYLSFSNIIDSYNRLIYRIKDINYSMFDICPCNIIYDNKDFKLIDTDGWKNATNLLGNISFIDKALIDSLKYSICFLNKDKYYKMFEKNNLSFDQYIYEIIEYFSNKYKINIVTINDLIEAKGERNVFRKFKHI